MTLKSDGTKNALDDGRIGVFREDDGEFVRLFSERRDLLLVANDVRFSGKRNLFLVLVVERQVEEFWRLIQGDDASGAARKYLSDWSVAVAVVAVTTRA